MNLHAFTFARCMATTLAVMFVCVAGAGMAAAQVTPNRPAGPPQAARQQPAPPAPTVAPQGLVTVCATFDYQGAFGARNMGVRVLNAAPQYVLQAEGDGIVVRTDYPPPNVPGANAAAMFDLARAAWTAKRSMILGIGAQGRLESINVQLGGANPC